MPKAPTTPIPGLTDLLSDRAGSGLCLVAPDGTVVGANAEWLRSTGFTQEQVVGEDVSELFPAARDMALAAEKEKYRSLFQNSLDAVYLALTDGTVLDANPAACRLHGMTLAEIRQAGRGGLVVQDERHAAAIAARANHGAVRAEMTIRRKDGTTVPVEVQSVLLDPAMAGSAVFVISRDISAQKRHDEELRASLAAARWTEQQLRDAVARYERQVRLFEGVASTTPDFVYLFDLEGRFLYANRGLLEVWGMQLSDVIGRTCRELGYEQWHHDMHMREIAQVIGTRRPIKGEVPFTAPLTGTFGIYEYIFTPVIGPDGEVEIIAGTTRDVTERKRHEEALLSREADLARAQATAHLGSWRWDLARDEVSWSDELYRIFGVDPATFVPSNAAARELIHPDDRDRQAQLVAAALTGRHVAPFESRIVRPGGEERTVLASGLDAELDATGKPTVLFGTVLDVTEQKRTENALREADRRKDEFLGMLSHELRNPLAPIRNSAYILRRARPGSDEARRAQDVIERQTEHLTRLVSDLLDVTRIAHGRIELRRTRVDLRGVVSHAADDFRLTMHDRGVRFDVAIPDRQLWADADATRITQVLGNLLHNAAKFTKSGDAVALTLAAGDQDAVISVRDTGAGMDAALLPTIFDPFVQGERTLARTEGGLGLGLALVKSVVELHGGTVRADSAGKGMGSEFVVRLPLRATLEAEPSPPPLAVQRTG